MKSVTKTERIYFKVGNINGLAFTECQVEFDWYMGMSWQVRQRSSISMHKSINKNEPGLKILEVSTKSTNYELGKSLSAFNLTLNGIRVENIFQSSKIFNDGGPYVDLLSVDPSIAKKDHRIQIGKEQPNRKLIKFKYNNLEMPLEPKSLFYDYIYIRALSQHPNLMDKILEYDIFTDIEFNQKVPYASKKGPFNCQARACAIFVWLNRNNLLDKYIYNPFEFTELIYPPSQKSLLGI